MDPLEDRYFWILQVSIVFSELEVYASYDYERAEQSLYLVQAFLSYLQTRHPTSQRLVRVWYPHPSLQSL